MKSMRPWLLFLPVAAVCTGACDRDPVAVAPDVAPPAPQRVVVPTPAGDLLITTVTLQTPTYRTGRAQDVSPTGIAVGWHESDMMNVTGHPGYVAVRWLRDGQMQALPLPAECPAGALSKALGINPQGTIVGNCFWSVPGTLTMANRAIVWRKDGTQPEVLPLPAEAVNAWAGDINPRGDVAGVRVVPDESEQWFLWTKQGVTPVTTPAPDGFFLGVHALAPSGMLLGSYSSYPALTQTSIRWNVQGVPEVLAGVAGWPVSVARDMNHEGVVIGNVASSSLPGLFIRPARWPVTGPPELLPIGPASEHVEIHAIGEADWIVGTSRDMTIGNRSFLWSEQLGRVPLEHPAATAHCLSPVELSGSFIVGVDRCMFPGASPALLWHVQLLPAADG